MYSATTLLHFFAGGHRDHNLPCEQRTRFSPAIRSARTRVLATLLFVMITCAAKAQQADNAGITNMFSDSILTSLKGFPSKYYSKVNKKIGSVDGQLTKKTLKYLQRFHKQEEKLQQKLHQLNPGSNITKSENEYKSLEQKIKSKTGVITKLVGAGNIPYADSLGTSLSFLKKFDGIGSKAELPIESLRSLECKFTVSDQVKSFIAERKNRLQELLSKYTGLPAGLKNEYTKLSKTAYYYSAEVKKYKDMLKDRKKMEKTAMEVLNKIPAFQKFMQKNSQLASLFPLPGNTVSGSTLIGLQTRSSVQSLIQQRIAAGGPNAQAQLQANIAAAQAELGKIKDKLNQFTGGGSSNLEMPDFKPNTQRTKPFLKRIEYTANVQFDKSNNLLPATANIGLGVGYKLNDKGSAGVGMSYKLGMGTIQHISFTSQGLGLRSYFNWKLKKTIYVAGGYELNYNAAFKDIEQLKEYSAWQRSALVGLSKKYKISKKVHGEMQLLYDFLANTHIPVSQPFVFRLGYKF